MAVGVDGAIIKTIDGGINWEKINSGTNATLFSISFANDTIGFAAGHTGNTPTILKTIDGGASWFSSSSGVVGGLESVYFTDPENGYVAGGGVGVGWDDNGAVHKTTDGGATWTHVLTRGFYCVNAYFSSPDTGFVLTFHLNPSVYGRKYEISKTTDGGVSWNHYLIGEIDEVGVRAVSLPDNNTGYAACEGGIIFKTTDGGVTWAELAFITEKHLYSAFFTDINTGYIVGEGVILETNDGGATWYQDTTVTEYLSSVHFPSADTGYIAGDNGTILKTTSSGVSGINKHEIINSHFNFYPNPSKHKITLETTLNGETQLLIFNLNGQQMMERKFLDSNLEIDISKLPAGIYFVKIQNRNNIEVKKLIKE